MTVAMLYMLLATEDQKSLRQMSTLNGQAIDQNSQESKHLKLAVDNQSTSSESCQSVNQAPVLNNPGNYELMSADQASSISLCDSLGNLAFLKSNDFSDVRDNSTEIGNQVNNQDCVVFI